MFQLHIFIGVVNKQAREISGRLYVTATHITLLIVATYIGQKLLSGVAHGV